MKTRKRIQAVLAFVLALALSFSSVLAAGYDPNVDYGAILADTTISAEERAAAEAARAAKIADMYGGVEPPLWGGNGTETFSDHYTDIDGDGTREYDWVANTIGSSLDEVQARAAGVMYEAAKQKIVSVSAAGKATGAMINDEPINEDSPHVKTLLAAMGQQATRLNKYEAVVVMDSNVDYYEHVMEDGTVIKGSDFNKDTGKVIVYEGGLPYAYNEATGKWEVDEDFEDSLSTSGTRLSQEDVDRLFELRAQMENATTEAEREELFNETQKIREANGYDGGVDGSFYTPHGNDAGGGTVYYIPTVADTYYTIMASSTAGGTISPSGRRSVLRGSTRTYSIIPDNGYAVESIVVDGQNVGKGAAYTFTNINGNHTIHATFVESDAPAKPPLTITAAVSGGGTVDPMGSVLVPYGGYQSFTFTPADGYEIDQIYVDGAPAGTGPVYSFYNVTKDHVITCTFKFDDGEDKNTYSITSSAGPNGTITPSGTVTVEEGEDFTFFFTPDPDYKVETVYVDGKVVAVSRGNSQGRVDGSSSDAVWQERQERQETGAYEGVILDADAFRQGMQGVGGYEFGQIEGTSYTFTNVNANHTISVTFVHTGQFTITASAGENGSISPSGVRTVNKNSNQSFSFIPKSGYEVDQVLVDGQNVGSLTSYTFYRVQDHHTIHVTFKEKDDDNKVFQISASAGPNGTISPYGTIRVNAGSDAVFSATPDAGYKIKGVYVDGTLVSGGGGSGGTQVIHTFRNVQKNSTIRVEFEKDGLTEYSITSSAGPNGTISPNGTVTVTEGGSITFTATPDIGYKVSAMYVDGTSVGAKTSHTFSNVRANHSISVVFAKNTGIQYWEITASAGPNGSISPNGTARKQHGTNVPFTFTPRAGYEVDQILVDGINKGNANNYTFFNLTSNHTIHVTFKVAGEIEEVTGEITGPGDTGDVTDDTGLEVIKSGYGIGVSIDVESSGVNIVSVKVRHSVTGNIYTLELVDGKWILPVNPSSPTGARVDYIPAETADGTHKWDVIVTAKTGDGSTIEHRSELKYIIDGTMYEDDFTGDNR